MTKQISFIKIFLRKTQINQVTFSSPSDQVCNFNNQSKFPRNLTKIVCSFKNKAFSYDLLGISKMIVHL